LWSQAIAGTIVFNFVDPARPGRRLLGQAGRAGLKTELVFATDGAVAHALLTFRTKIGAVNERVEPSSSIPRV
jgi:hypothetical protein